MNHALDKDIVEMEVSLVKIADAIDDLISDCMTIPENERPDFMNLENIMNYIRENL